MREKPQKRSWYEARSKSFKRPNQPEPELSVVGFALRDTPNSFARGEVSLNPKKIELQAVHTKRKLLQAQRKSSSEANLRLDAPRRFMQK